MPLNDSVDVPISQAITLLYAAIYSKNWEEAESLARYIDLKCKIEDLLLTPREERLLDCVNDGSEDPLHNEGYADYGSGITLHYTLNLEESKVHFAMISRCEGNTVGKWHVSLKGVHQRFVLGTTRFKSNPATFSEAFPDLDPMYEHHVLQGWEIYEKSKKELYSRDNFSF